MSIYLSKSQVTDRLAPGIDYSLYPERWEDYIGQEAVKRQMKVAVQSAKIRNAPMPHTLIAHPSPGVGKTALAALVAKERGTTCRLVTGVILADQARILLSSMSDGDILVWDEIHRAVEGGRKNVEWMLTFLQDGVIEGPLGMEKQPAITVIGATTDPQKLPPALLSRFPIQPVLDEYTVEEGRQIAQLMAEDLLSESGLEPLVDEDAAIIATAADCNPRAIRNLLVNLRDLTLVGELDMDGVHYDVAGMLVFQGVTEDGLDQNAQRYLATLVTEFSGKAGMRNLQDRLQIAGGLGETENALMKRGLLAKTGTGRQITAAGIKRFGELMEVAA